MKLTPKEWYELGCQFSEISKKIEEIHMMLLVYVNENSYCLKIAENTSECFNVVLRDELISLLFNAYPKSDYLPEYDDLLLMDVFYHKIDLYQTINYGNLSIINKPRVIELCFDVIGYIDKLYMIYKEHPVTTLNRIIINIQKIIRRVNKLV